MILPDVNILIYAFHEKAPEHPLYAAWLDNVRQAGDDLLLPAAVLTGFLRIVTNPRVVVAPPSAAQAMSFVTALIRGVGVRQVSDESAVWQRFSELIEGDPQIRGNLVPDAYLAAVAISHGASLASRDRGFARFPGLRWFDPASSMR